MSDILTLSATQARKALDGKSISALELTNAYLDAADATVNLNAYTAITHDKARMMAANSDARLAKGCGGALEGLPIGVKDLF
ncbi:MAG: amidase family protein, partial [Candidatus Puniceispirillales bacterium WSBS_2018_MAG_OTU23]